MLAKACRAVEKASENHEILLVIHDLSPTLTHDSVFITQMYGLCAHSLTVLRPQQPCPQREVPYPACLRTMATWWLCARWQTDVYPLECYFPRESNEGVARLLDILAHTYPETVVSHSLRAYSLVGDERPQLKLPDAQRAYQVRASRAAVPPDRT